jgi:hypothetical protein
MKIDSTKNYLGKAFGFIIFEGSGDVDGESTESGQVVSLVGIPVIYFTKDYQNNYKVILITTAGEMSISLSDVENQPTWTNDVDGKDACIASIIDWSKEATSISSEVTGSVEVSNLPTSPFPAYDPNLYPLPWGGFITSYTDETKTIVSYIQFYTVVNGFFGEGVFAWVYDYSVSTSTSMRVILGEY